MVEQIKDAAFYSHEAYNRGLVGGTGGNASVRVGDDFYITPTGSTLGDIAAEEFVRVPVFGSYPIAPNEPKPSKEAGLHQGIYQTRPDIQAILHLHPAYCIAAALLLRSETEIPAYTPGYFLKIGSLPIVEFNAPGSVALRDSLVKAFSKANWALMKNHGLIVGVKTMKEAFCLTEEIEANAHLHILLHGQGALSDAEKALLRSKPG